MPDISLKHNSEYIVSILLDTNEIIRLEISASTINEVFAFLMKMSFGSKMPLGSKIVFCHIKLNNDSEPKSEPEENSIFKTNS